jgi:tetratricopeptide (TPR) repeat protein
MAAALRLHQAGRLKEAEAIYRRVLEVQPRHADALHLLGVAAHHAGRPAEAIDLIGKAIAAGGRVAVYHNNMGEAYRAQDKFDEAVLHYRQALAIEPDFAMAHNNLANALIVRDDRDDLDGAVSHLRRVLELDPDRAEAHYNLGICYQHQGRFGEAVACHQKAIALKPEHTRAHYNLVINKSFTPGKEATTRLETLLESSDLPAAERANLHFAWAKILDDQGSVDEAFSHYQAANELRSKEADFDPEVYVQYISKVISVFTKDFFEQRQWAGSDSELPVFIIGMPRSGTTLVEQIIASHPQAFGAGELEYLGRMGGTLPATLKTSTPYPDCAALIDRETARRLAEGYLDHLRSRSEAAERITDKMPNNLLGLGLIALMFSRARIIHCRRDPLDTCLSCYFHAIPRVWDYSYDLTHLGIVYRQYERIMAHWRRASPLPMLEVAYEELVADQEGVSRRIIEFSGLEWDDRCLAFHEHDRPIRTLSFWQARQPIYTSSVGRWRQYEKYLDPLKESLGLTET